MSTSGKFIKFKKYCWIGVFNTLLHWGVFGFVFFLGGSQAVSNLVGFLVAVTSSFYLNSKWTFGSPLTLGRYGSMLCVMSTLSWFVGKIADLGEFHPIVTLFLFSSLSLIFGFFFTKHFVFRTPN